jgi:two-component system chemotaxis response regulator CheY
LVVPAERGKCMAYRVLIVDDSPAMRSFVIRVIRLSGFELSTCFEASNGQEALDLLRQEWVDVILSDINMPGVDGEEFLQRLAGDEVLRSIPVIVISTDATQSRIERLLALGARGYITKPFLPETLRVELETTLGVPCD